MKDGSPWQCVDGKGVMGIAFADLLKCGTRAARVPFNTASKALVGLARGADEPGLTLVHLNALTWPA